MADIAPMLGAIFGTKRSPKAKAAKSKSKSAAKKVAIVVHSESPSANAQHTTPADHKMPTEHQRMKENAKSEMRHATDSWVSGHMTTDEHCAVHARAKHVLSNKPVREFKGKSGERKMKLR